MLTLKRALKNIPSLCLNSFPIVPEFTHLCKAIIHLKQSPSLLIHVGGSFDSASLLITLFFICLIPVISMSKQTHSQSFLRQPLDPFFCLVLIFQDLSYLCIIWLLRVLVVASVQFSHSVMCNCLLPHGPQHARPPCPSPTPGVYTNSCPLS